MTDSPTPQEAPSTATLPAPQGLSCDHHGIVSPMGLTALWQIGDTYRTRILNDGLELPTRTVDGAAWVPAGEPGLFRLVAKPGEPGFSGFRKKAESKDTRAFPGAFARSPREDGPQ